MRLLVHFAILLLALAAASAQPSPGSVVLYGQGVGARDALYLAGLFLAPPDASYDIAHQVRDGLPRPGEFGEAAVVIVGSLDEKSGTTWTPEEVAAAVDWVSDGHTLIFLGNAPVVLAGGTQRLGPLAPLLGFTKLQSGSGRQSVIEGSPITEGLAQADWMEAGGSTATGLGAARSLLSNGATALATEHSLGSGSVYYFGRDVTRIPLADGLRSYSEMVGRAILSGPVIKSPSKRESWALEPLGGEVPANEAAPGVRRQLAPTLRTVSVQGDPLVVARDGSPQTAIVLADRPTPAAREGAELLARTLSQLTGGRFPIVNESSLTVSRDANGAVSAVGLSDDTVYPGAMVVGDTALGTSLGITSADLPLEGYRVVSKGRLLFLCGSDRRPDGLELAGTRFAVSAFLERQAGVRWLWPGAGGTVLPKNPNLQVGPMDEWDAPALQIRKMRDIVGGAKRFETDPVSGAVRAKASGRRTATGIALLGRDLATHLQRHGESAEWFDAARLGQSSLISATHAFSGWWDRHGRKHPEWFSLQPTGYRTQIPPREQFCQSNIELVEAIAEATLAKLAEDPQRDVVSIAPNDVGRNSYCFCADCRKKDPVNGVPTPVRYVIGDLALTGYYPALSDRMVEFFGRIAAAVNRLRPGSRVGVTAYNAYRAAPLAARLPENSVLVFVGTNYFDQTVLETDRRNWNRWASSASELILRPNTLHQGHAMPAVFVKGLSEDLRHGYETGMVGADYDSVVHHWATQGLNYYVLAKLLWDPSASTDEIVDDYCRSGFGSAAATIREYFAALETHTIAVARQMGQRTGDVAQSADDEDPEVPAGAEYFMKQIPRFYPPERIAEWQELLSRARAEAAKEPEVLSRIGFLEEGLRYALWQVKFFQALEDHPPLSEPLRAVAQDRRTAFQDIFDRTYFAVQFGTTLWREEFFWKQAGITLPENP